MLNLAVCGVVACVALSQAELPVVTVDRDDFVIDRSCRVVIPDGLVIADAVGDGVIQIRADGVTVEFDADRGVLRGAREGTPWNELTGRGIVVDGASNVTIRGARVHGFKGGIVARNADGLVIEDTDVSDNFAQRLRSTPAAEDGGDWLWPHRNDGNEWLNNYGAGIYIESSDGVAVRNSRARRVQNGLLLSRVNNARIYDNDFSFLSGWGLGLWRSSDNVITRNAFDFCVRGYSHEVYNRGQDSAGILMFEQNHRNVIAENSATHGGDGFFGFAGREALGETWRDRQRQRLRRETGRDDVDDLLEADDELIARHRRLGNNDNLLINNDFSYAPAHGIEMTFSFGNRFIGNRLVGNAICGVWGGYSQETLIAGNHFEDNGNMPYGLERGGVNIEHGWRNRIVGNTFRNNRAGVHLWWRPNDAFLALPWAKANANPIGHRKIPSAENIVAFNTFEGDDVVLHLRRSDVTYYYRNTVRDVDEEFRIEDDSPVETSPLHTAHEVPECPVYGNNRPVGARGHLGGRENIIMTEWFPWDHSSPLIRFGGSDEHGDTYEVFNLSADSIRVDGPGVIGEVIQEEDAVRVRVRAPSKGVFGYEVHAEEGDYERTIPGTLVRAEWDVVFFPWEPADPAVADPPPDLEAWRALAESEDAARARVPALRFNYGFGGPSNLGISREVTEAGFGPDHFGMIARTELPLTAGTWRVRTRSDDGVRVMVDGDTVLENWTHHGPTTDTGRFTLERDRAVRIVVEHFEIMGYAVLEFEIEPVRD